MGEFIDLTGQTFRKLLVVGFIGKRRHCSYYLCRCLLCGKEFEVRADGLKTQISCMECANKKKIIDITGQKFGRLTVVSLLHKGSRIYWKCLCECGKEMMTRGHSLISGGTKSCGCLCSELSSIRAFKHGMKDIPEYYIWAAINTRTTNKNYTGTERYMGRGIKVCDEWRHSFEQFYKDMGDRPSPKHSIDRIDNDGDYSPENCRWATAIEQANNTSTTIHLEVNGETKTLREWSAITGLRIETMRDRLYAGWNPGRIITEEVGYYRSPNKNKPNGCK